MSEIGLLFPGQGSQYVGMGEDLYNDLLKSRKILDTASDMLGYEVKKLIFESSSEELRKTENAQISIFLVSMMYFEKWKTLGKDCQIAAGHSLGEYSALCAADVLSFEEALHLVAVRGKLMADCCSDQQGMMAIIGLSLDHVCELISRNSISAEVANINSLKQTVLSGLRSDLAIVEDLLNKIEGCSVRWLNVGGAFHSSFMTPAKIHLKKEIEKITFKKPVCQIISNTTGKETKDPEEIKSNLIDQTDSCVKWLDTILRMKELGAIELYEIGPGEVLKKLNGTITFKPKCHSL